MTDGQIPKSILVTQEYIYSHQATYSLQFSFTFEEWSIIMHELCQNGEDKRLHLWQNNNWVVSYTVGILKVKATMNVQDNIECKIEKINTTCPNLWSFITGKAKQLGQMVYENMLQINYANYQQLKPITTKMKQILRCYEIPYSKTVKYYFNCSNGTQYCYDTNYCGSYPVVRLWDI